MARSLSDIKIEISARLISDEYLPKFIQRTEDLKDFCDSVAEFIAPYEKQLEDFEDIWTNLELLKSYLESKHMIFNGTENLAAIQNIAANRLKIIAARGTMNMSDEIKRICNEDTYTGIDFKDFGYCGWTIGHTSPCYRSSSTALNVSYIGIRECVIFNLKNLNIYLDQETLRQIMEDYFVPKHIVTLLNFIS